MSGSQDVAVERSIDALVSRADVWITRERIEELLRTGTWDPSSFVVSLESKARVDPNAPALSDEDGRVLTYGVYEQRTRGFALGLLRLGLQPGDRVALQLPNVSEFCIALLGCARVRMLPVLAHMPYGDQELRHVLECTRARALITLPTFRGRNHAAMAFEAKERLAFLDQIIVVGSVPGAVSFEQLTNTDDSAAPQVLERLRPNGIDPFFIMFTSGTTGRPKAELHLHANNAYWTDRMLDVHPPPEGSKALLLPPVAHLTALGMGVLTALRGGAAFTLATGWDPQTCLRLVERDKPSHLIATPPMLVDLAAEDLERWDLSSLQSVYYAGAPCPQGTLEELAARLGVEIVSVYGFTECGATHCTRKGDPLSVTATSIGSPIPGIDIKLTADDGREVEPPGEGLLWCRGPNFIPGYYGQPQLTQRMFTTAGWFRSGDLVRIDHEGRGYFLSRTDDLINRGGYKIDPREVEEILVRHPRIRQVCVVGLPDPRLGQRAVAFVVPRCPGDELSLDELTRFLEQRGVGKSKWPEAVRALERLPMTSTGKITRAGLREQAGDIFFSAKTRR